MKKLKGKTRVADILYMLTRLLLKTTLWGMYQYEPHFSDED